MNKLRWKCAEKKNSYCGATGFIEVVYRSLQGKSMTL